MSPAILFVPAGMALLPSLASHVGDANPMLRSLTIFLLLVVAVCDASPVQKLLAVLIVPGPHLLFNMSRAQYLGGLAWHVQFLMLGSLFVHVFSLDSEVTLPEKMYNIPLLSAEIISRHQHVLPTELAKYAMWAVGCVGLYAFPCHVWDVLLSPEFQCHTEVVDAPFGHFPVVFLTLSATVHSCLLALLFYGGIDPMPLLILASMNLMAGGFRLASLLTSIGAVLTLTEAPSEFFPWSASAGLTDRLIAALPRKSFCGDVEESPIHRVWSPSSLYSHCTICMELLPVNR
ncbi:MAG: uncharacterized protein KVP18_004183 [Porospora cf. gigantea A]|uniref:uncharacterized protein n=1 Tax=Porospora cf. gigantea A TaxID=2853593 RepID=UPI003559FA68|nr:MAG: hypothetical protein KVP18_004183 [Porospora cf. gigantea A]